MGKSKNGGTRSMLRGRVGSDVYSVGKDSFGKRQQVVRSLAETVANPQTAAQMKGRAIMSTVMQGVSALSQIIDHSFDAYSAGQPNVSEFIRRNYALIKADVAAHPSTGNAFGIVEYGEKGAKQGTYVIADGKAVLPAALVNAATKATLTVSGESLTVAAIKSAIGLGADEYITLVGISATGAAEIARFRMGSTLSDETVVSASNVADLFAIEANCTPVVAVNGMAIEINLPNAQANSAIIISKLVSGVYEHNKATLLAVDAPANTFDVAIATYPIGEARLLNGGNFNGGESGGVTPSPAPTPSTNPQLTAVSINGTSILSGNVQVSESGFTQNLNYTLDSMPESGTLRIGYVSNGNFVSAGNLTSLTGSLTLSAIGSGQWQLRLGDEVIQTLAIVNGSANAVSVNAPTISGNTSFTDATQVTISGDSGAEIHYTTDGTDPTSESTTYSEPFTLSATATVKAIAIVDGTSSSVASKTFTKTSESGGFDLGG